MEIYLVVTVSSSDHSTFLTVGSSLRRSREEGPCLCDRRVADRITSEQDSDYIPTTRFSQIVDDKRGLRGTGRPKLSRETDF